MRSEIFCFCGLETVILYVYESGSAVGARCEKCAIFRNISVASHRSTQLSHEHPTPVHTLPGFSDEFNYNNELKKNNDHLMYIYMHFDI
jgi:hypothetical protein